jgi:hypothetical protein
MECVCMFLLYNFHKHCEIYGFHDGENVECRRLLFWSCVVLYVAPMHVSSRKTHFVLDIGSHNLV